MCGAIIDFLIAAESSEKPYSPGDIQPFISPASATADSVVRNIPESENVETVSSDQQAPPKSPTAQRGSVSCTSTGEQEQNHGEHSSDIVLSKPALPATCAAPQPDSTQPRKDAIGERDVTIGDRDTTIGERDTTITKKDATIEKKDKEINELEKHKRELERYLLEKDDKIKQQKEQLEKEQEKLKKALEQKIAQLEGDVDQKDRELQQEKDDKHETCQQLREQLKHERAAKRKLERDLVEERIKHLQGAVDRTKSEVNTTWQERTNISQVIIWNEEDLTRRQHEKQQQRKYTISFISIAVGFFAILVLVVPHYTFFVLFFCFVLVFVFFDRKNLLMRMQKQ